MALPLWSVFDMYNLYILICDEGKYYTGITNDLERRLIEHNNPNGKKSRFTKKYSNWKVVHTEEYETLSEVRSRENEIKSWKGGNKFRELIEQSR